MRKSLPAALFSILLSAFVIEHAHAQLTSLTEGFDTVGSVGPPATGIYAAGWLTINNSSPLVIIIGVKAYPELGRMGSA